MDEIIDLETSESKDELQLRLANLTTNNTRQSISLFDVVIEETDEEMKETAYEAYLKSECSEWSQLIKKAKLELTATSESKNKKIIEKTILLPDQIQYLEAMPDFQKFINDSTEFQIKAHNYLLDYTDTNEMKDELAQLCIAKLETIALDNVNKYI